MMHEFFVVVKTTQHSTANAAISQVSHQMIFSPQLQSPFMKALKTISTNATVALRNRRTQLREDGDEQTSQTTVDVTGTAMALLIVITTLGLFAFQVYATIHCYNKRVKCSFGAKKYAIIAIIALAWLPVPLLSGVASILVLLNAFTCIEGVPGFGSICPEYCVGNKPAY